MKVTVDGHELDLPAGTSAIDAVFESGGDVPYFCAHPYLSPVGACRMCLVESGSPRKNPDGSFVMEGEGDAARPKIFWFPKPMASCTMQATEGMHIRTAKTSDVVAKAQAGMMEFTLLNHPLDCPTCDKGGACELQDRAFEYGYGASRYGFDRRHADKHYPLSDFVILDQERCIHCKRCVRYFEEVPGQEVLDFIERGGHTFIDTEEGGLPLGFQGNITDICPVGALLDNVARFRGRNWEYDHTPTTCTLCPVGCSITADARNGRLERVVARENREVNEAWICDAGRFGHPFASEERLTTPLIRNEDGELVPATWDQAITAINRGLAGLPLADLGLFVGADATLEEGVALEALADALQARHVDHGPRQAVHIAPTATLTDVAQADFVAVLGADLGEEAPVLELRLLEMLRGGVLPPEFAHGTAIADLRLVERPARKTERLAVIGGESRLWTHAGHRIAASGAAALSGLAQPGTPALRAVREALDKAERPVLILGADVLNAAGGSFAAALADLAGRTGAKVLGLPAGPNSLGLGALNLVPRAGGLGVNRLAEVPAAFISRLDPGVRARGFTVVHDLHLTATAQLADVVLPAVSNYEKRGTTVNLEGRLLPLASAAIQAGDSADLIRTLTALAEALGVKAPVRGLRGAQTLAQTRLGVNLAELPAQGQLHTFPRPYTAPTQPHTPRLWTARMVRRDQDWVDRIADLTQGGWTLPVSPAGPQPGGDD
ncbi:NADH-quinone oxidoreductase subunit NuoG [Deinococcus multiflagellatus]|uniref:NADH-quinone oxidoreductase subunit NuoG n=1 Tax=Deinococcus multiflagellatus TaxID=1656887 RepID=UPI001CCF9981|nr:NADH-quinone oxidoreductase subunit NuoG [Deinococcus multiflagellatus]MBZ9712561.1 NADH-quinone oxidoreductase subunit NuoG [Deinococcus multiflagellatus]